MWKIPTCAFWCYQHDAPRRRLPYFVPRRASEANKLPAAAFQQGTSQHRQLCADGGGCCGVRGAERPRVGGSLAWSAGIVRACALRGCPRQAGPPAAPAACRQAVCACARLGRALCWSQHAFWRVSPLPCERPCTALTQFSRGMRRCRRCLDLAPAPWAGSLPSRPVSASDLCAYGRAVEILRCMHPVSGDPIHCEACGRSCTRVHDKPTDCISLLGRVCSVN